MLALGNNGTSMWLLGYALQDADAGRSVAGRTIEAMAWRLAPGQPELRQELAAYGHRAWDAARRGAMAAEAHDNA